MSRIAVAIRSLLLAAISKLTGLSDARTSRKFMMVVLGVLLPSSVVIFTTNLRATSNIITVNNTTDPASVSGNGFCTLREAIDNANARSDTSGGDCVAGTGDDDIVFSVSGTITLGTNGSLPTILNMLTIDGTGETITVDGAAMYQVMVVRSGATLTLNDLTIADGNATLGGGILNSGTLTITGSSFSGNSAEAGGGIDNGGTLTVTNSTFSDNKASNSSGGGIYNSGTLTVTNSTFSGNSVTPPTSNVSIGGGGIFNVGTATINGSSFSGNSAGFGGGILQGNGTLTVTESTFSNNSAYEGGGIYTVASANVADSTFSGNSAVNSGSAGGGIFAGNGTLTVTNSTFSANSAFLIGGAIASVGVPTTVENSTFFGNAAGSGGGIYSFSTTVTNSILANESSGGNCAGAIRTGAFSAESGYNISDDGSCSFGNYSDPDNGDTIGDNVSDANLDLAASLANNGGPTETIALVSPSYAYNAIPIADCPSTDQRGYDRPDPGDSGADCDIGAFEYGGVVPPPTPTATATATPTATPSATATPAACGPGNVITVNTTGDPGSTGVCALRDAITAANTQAAVNGCAAGTGTDTINFSVSGTITLATSLPSIQNTLTIDGSGQTVTVDGGNTIQVMSVSLGANLSLNNLTISHGNNSAGNGGGIDNFGTLSVSNSTFSGNTAFDSGGIANESGGSATVTNSAFVGNTATGSGFGNGGGAILSLGTLSVSNSSFVGNTATGSGGACCGAIGNGGTTLIVSNSTFSDNSQSDPNNGGGGGIGTGAGTVTVTNSTFSGNTAFAGGAIAANGLIATATVVVTNSTFHGNSAAFGNSIIADNPAPVTVTNSILADGSGGNFNCLATSGGTITSGANSGYNISDDGTCGFGSSTAANGQTIGDNVSDGAIALDPAGLAANGGPTETIALELGSVAIDGVPIANCPATDQRGAPRPDPVDSQTACEVGAFEFGGVVLTATPTPTATCAPPTATPTATATATASATATATATATPTAMPTLSIHVPASITLGSSPVGDTSTKSLKVRNTGTELLFIGNITSNNPAEFAATGDTTCPPDGLAQGLTCTITIGFTPGALGARSATLQVSDNAATSPQSVAASGTGFSDMRITPINWVFGSVRVGSVATKAITVSNHQTNPVSLTLPPIFSGTNATDFSVTGGTCTSTLAATTACTLIVTYAPTAADTESATMTVTDSPDTLGPYTVSFTAAATIPESLSAIKLIFGNVAQTASKFKIITLTNDTTAPITLTGTSIGGTNSADLAVTGGSCPLPSGSLGASSSCTYDVTFTPSGETAESGTLSIGVAEDPNGGPPAVGLIGTGVTPLKVRPVLGINFGTIVGGQSSRNRTVTVSNNGGTPLTLSTSIGGPNPGDFVSTGGTCTGTLASGASCTGTLKFTPSLVGAESATIGVSAVGDAASPHNVSLGGTGS